MNEEYDDIPASLRRRKKEPQRMVQVRIPFSHFEELTDLAREYDQDVSTFVREAIEDWLRRARKARNADTEGA
jgi:DNA phosphorothioation-dependent restriction protein DptG